MPSSAHIRPPTANTVDRELIAKALAYQFPCCLESFVKIAVPNGPPERPIIGACSPSRLELIQKINFAVRFDYKLGYRPRTKPVGGWFPSNTSP